MSLIKQAEERFPGLLGALPAADLGLLGSAAIVFGTQRLVPTFDASWYKEIAKPTWTPPNWVFPAMWIPLKVLQSVSAWLVYKQAKSNKELALPLGVFGLHMVLGNAWNWVFFGRREMELSTKVMGAFWASIAGGIWSFWQVSPLAGALWAPTLAWVSVASALNLSIVRLNRGRDVKAIGGGDSGEKAK